MHYYHHNIKSFNSATRHLTRVERSLYRDLIELYYDTEQPLPADDLHRLARRVLAQTQEEIDALHFVLSEFFIKTGDVYTHEKCDEELEKYRTAKTLKAKAGKASAESRRRKAEALKQERERACANGNSTSDQHPLNECATNQEPITKNQEPIKNLKDSVQSAACTSAQDKPSDRFDEFWKAYPVKKNRKRAREIWKRKKLDTKAETLINDVINRSEHDDDWKRGYIPHATTYLNGERWDDEIKRPTGKNQGQNGNRTGGSAIEKVLSGIREAQTPKQGNHAAPVGYDDPALRPPMGEQLRCGGRSTGGVGSVIEGDFTRHDETGI